MGFESEEGCRRKGNQIQGTLGSARIQTGDGVNFTETFAPVVSLKTVRIILALMAAKDWHARHVDIDNAYLQGRLSEEVYIEEPDYFKTDTAKVCKLEKALYGLKQAGRAWNLTLANAFFE